MKHRMRYFTVLLLTTVVLSACTGLPDKIETVKDFNVERYQGKWYEIARLDHSFERGLSHVTATYTLNDDGSLKVINRGFSAEKNRFKTAEGRALFVNKADVGHLKVSFFGPFYSSYAIFDLDKKDYQYAFISGYNTSYLWLLARTPSVSKELITRFISHSRQLGFDTSQLIFVDHQ